MSRKGQSCDQYCQGGAKPTTVAGDHVHRGSWSGVELRSGACEGGRAEPSDTRFGASDGVVSSSSSHWWGGRSELSVILFRRGQTGFWSSGPLLHLIREPSLSWREKVNNPGRGSQCCSRENSIQPPTCAGSAPLLVARSWTDIRGRLLRATTTETWPCGLPYSPVAPISLHLATTLL